MRDRCAIAAGIIVLILGCLVFFTPKEFKIISELLPLQIAGIVILGLGTLILIVGLVSIIGEKYS